MLIGSGQLDPTAIPEKHRLGVLYHYCFAFCFTLYKHRSILYAKIVGIGDMRRQRHKILKLYASFSVIITCLFSAVKASRHFYEPLYLYYHFQILNYQDKSWKQNKRLLGKLFQCYCCLTCYMEFMITNNIQISIIMSYFIRVTILQCQGYNFNPVDHLF